VGCIRTASIRNGFVKIAELANFVAERNAWVFAKFLSFVVVKCMQFTAFKIEIEVVMNFVYEAVVRSMTYLIALGIVKV
jgi:hypothetical protein